MTDSSDQETTSSFLPTLHSDTVTIVTSETRARRKGWPWQRSTNHSELGESQPPLNYYPEGVSPRSLPLVRPGTSGFRSQTQLCVAAGRPVSVF